MSALALVLGSSLAIQGADREGTDYFELHVRPLLATECYACHSGQAPVVQAGLRVDSLNALLAGGNSGSALVPGSPEESLLMRVLRHEGRIRMPPAGKLTESQIGRISTWIRMGAPYPKPAEESAAEGSRATRHWALVPPKPVDPPDSGSGWGVNTIDRFVEARLARAGLKPSPEASPRTLVRRIHYDLTGLPPPPDVTEAFVRSPTAHAYADLVDSLLASDHFGERWARHWLDVVRYADEGYFGRPFPAAWTYRDWVVDAINEDLPYDRFVLYQLSADLAGVDRRHLPALGMLTLGINLPRAIELPQNLDDRIDVVTRGLLGLSVSCARCHDHKFDPITQEDYYSLYAVFLNSPDALEPVPIESLESGESGSFFRDKLAMRREWLDKFRVERLADHVRDFRKPETLARYLQAAWDSRSLSDREAETLSKEEDLNLYMLNRWRAYLNGLVGPSVEAFRDLDSTGGAQRVAERIANADSQYRWPDPQKEALRLALRGNGSPTDVPFEDFWWVQNEGDGNVMKALKWQYEAVLHEWSHRGGPRHASVVRDAKKVQPAFIFVRGNQHDKGAEVPARFLSALSGSEPFRSGSGRLELAQAIASESNPLTARVMVNRVWAHLFGEGLVRTTSDFGIRGERPTHPELLDYLASEFVADGWSVKDLIRKVVLSRTYRQSSRAHDLGVEEDPANRLLWRQNRSRLDFEALRDSMLAVAGRLDTSMGGTPFDLKAQPSSPRRTLYAYVSREHPSQLMRAFDFSNPEEHSPRRQLTTVPQQALFLMNSPFLAEQARAVAATCGETPKCVDQIHHRILGRPLEPHERREALELLAEDASNKTETERRAATRSAWLHGVARIDPSQGLVSGFRQMDYRVDERLQPAPMLPSPRTGRASLTASGGFPGDGLDSAVVRRWRAPRAMRVDVEGKLSHAMGGLSRRFNHSNGVRGWVVSNRRGVLASWTVRGGDAGTSLGNLELAEGEHLDFVVDSLGDYESDKFSWAPRIKEILPADRQDADMEPQVWSAEDDFPQSSPGRPLSPIEQYAQVLLMTNEFAFRD